MFQTSEPWGHEDSEFTHEHVRTFSGVHFSWSSSRRLSGSDMFVLFQFHVQCHVLETSSTRPLAHWEASTHCPAVSSHGLTLTCYTHVTGRLQEKIQNMSRDTDSDICMSCCVVKTSAKFLRSSTFVVVVVGGCFEIFSVDGTTSVCNLRYSCCNLHACITAASGNMRLSGQFCTLLETRFKLQYSHEHLGAVLGGVHVHETVAAVE